MPNIDELIAEILPAVREVAKDGDKMAKRVFLLAAELCAYCMMADVDLATPVGIVGATAMRVFEERCGKVEIPRTEQVN